MSKTINIHVKILTEPTKFTVEEMTNAAKMIFETAGIQIKLKSEEKLDVTQDDLAFLNTVDTGDCAEFGMPSEEVQSLSEFRRNATSKDIVVYICRSVRAKEHPAKGCGGSSPEGRPMVVIAKSANLFTMAHEIGHVFGLKHSHGDETRLMTDNGTQIFDEDVEPVLVRSEIDTINESDLVSN